MGTITQVMSSAGGRTYILEVADQGLLPLSVGEVPPPFGAVGVTIVVPADLDIPTDVEGQFAVLSTLVDETGESLRVVDYIPQAG